MWGGGVVVKKIAVGVLLLLLAFTSCAAPAPPAEAPRPGQIPPTAGESPSTNNSSGEVGREPTDNLTTGSPSSTLPAQPITPPVQLPPVRIVAAPSSRSLPSYATAPAPDQQLAQYALALINKDRASNGLAPVILGSNGASQIHADEMQAKNYIAHWDLDGLKPYMRYTMAGGFNYEAENLFLIFDPHAGHVGFVPLPTRDPKAMLDEAEVALMNSPGHRATILNKWNKKVSLGISYGPQSLALDQQFEGDYLIFSKPPAISNGILSLLGQTSGGAVIEQIQIWYDVPPHSLTLGQLGQSGSYWHGEPTVFIRPPAPPGSRYLESEKLYSWDTALDPYDVPADTPPPPPSGSPSSSEPAPSQASKIIKAVDARLWNVSPSSFAIEADISGALTNSGSGVYTVVMWGNIGGESFSVSNYSLLVR